MHFIGIEINHRSVVYIIKENTVAGYFASMFEKAEKTWMKIDKRAFQFMPGCNHKWRQFLKQKFEKQLGYILKLDLWGALKGRMAVRFESEWHDVSGQWYRSYGVQVFQFNDDGYAEKRFASQETVTIGKSELQGR